ncbi:BLUF domain-containing protein [uncultured Roseobacter sp.]|uniref:BLUF domain-containing protein n=1 Tax=uncultured Roseobacter sp. TaxID=114847 RepID=UPI002615CB35|nr:BLUF domain-containing protein [uncultured Roseobacter sp.]
MPELYHALYHSQSLVPDTPSVHNEILTVSQRNNSVAGISGFLHREGDFFLQYLEGPKTLLFSTLARIGRDPRHKNFEIIESGTARTRMLPDWQMGFTDPSQLRISDLLHVSENQLQINALDPFDIVTLLVNNSHGLRSSVAA